jgi:hypothetical protein
MSRCVGTLENDIGEFYHHSSDFMRSMFPASLPELEVRAVSNRNRVMPGGVAFLLTRAPLLDSRASKGVARPSDERDRDESIRELLMQRHI